MAKEILKDEILNDEQLEQVAGGSFSEIRDDIKKLQKIGFDIDNVNSPSDLNQDVLGKMRAAFGRFGITVRETTGPADFTGQFNGYFLNGKALSRERA
ncbi:MAG: hypothetical protein SR3Q1_10355 [Quinella sp. 3Q1]|nr:hypothetical protein [Quinella sp. 3Q1]MBR3050512.1 hypothetical protein [Selenomonadaceae bacterium]MBR6887571.1 hypothetical protein [Selenomonadaceae bacterium]